MNLASRIQSLGQENNILVSGEFYDKIKNNSAFSVVSLGQFEFKNVAKPLEVLALCNEGLSIPRRSKMEGKLRKKSRLKQFIVATSLILFCAAVFFIIKTFLPGASASTSKEQSIAVLPFVDMSPDKDQEYFSDGMSEELLNLLSKIPDLKVISRTSSFSFKGKNEDVRKIGENLGVANVLEGSIRKSGSKIRITAQLIEVQEGTHLWSETFEREMSDVLLSRTKFQKRSLTF